jgi:hypothetical protein
VSLGNLMRSSLNSALLHAEYVGVDTASTLQPSHCVFGGRKGVHTCHKPHEGANCKLEIAQHVLRDRRYQSYAWAHRVLRNIVYRG